MNQTPSLVVADACFLLNLLASAKVRDIIRGLEICFILVPHVRNETLYLMGPPDPEGNPTKTRIDLSPFEEHKEIRVEPVDNEAWRGHFIQCAELLTDADAASVAMAAALGIPLGSDDGKVRRVAKKLYPDMELWATLGTLKRAAEALSWGEDTVRVVLGNLRVRGHFAPPKADPDRAWYEALTGGTVATSPIIMSGSNPLEDRAR